MLSLAQASPDPIAPLWFVGPACVIALVVVSAHVVAIGKAEMPASRRRIRTVNGVLMMFTIPMLAYAFGVATPDRPRLFGMVWTLVVGLLAIVLFLAALDIANTWRLNWLARRELRRQIVEARNLAATRSGRVGV